MNAFIVTTYNVPNLRISLSSIARYVAQEPYQSFCLLINNDNPNYLLGEKYVRQFVSEELIPHLKIVNTDKNLGCLGARLKSIKALYSWKGSEINYFMFVDDDDVVLQPDFNSDKWTISHRAVVVHRLLEVLTLIDKPKPDLANEFVEYEEWKMGCVGVPYKLSRYYQYICQLEGYLPELYQIYGSERVLEPDDIILMNLWNVYLNHHQGSLNGLFDKKDCFSYALTFLEDRKGRYKVDEGTVDLRYGNWDGKTTYASLITPMIEGFRKYLEEKYPSLKK